MAYKFRIEDNQELYFLTSTVVDWIDVFTRREWMLNKFEFAGRWNPKIENFKFWQDGIHPIV